MIVTWGVFNWDYGKRAPHAQKEGWFGKDTKYAGIDKIGHFYATYLLTHYLSFRYEKYGYEKEYAIQNAALSSFFLNAVMEIGDFFGDYGFSYEDLVFNAVGSYLGYYLLTHPKLDKIIDIRVEYKPTEKITSGKSFDILTDYNGMKFLIAVKLEGFRTFEDTFLGYIEFQAGYYVRKRVGSRYRYPYVAFGINFSRLLYPMHKKVSRVLEFYQPPFGYISNILK